ncbi:hypothetical protein V8E54_006746, partial [Elaphomyces granulatus]
MDRIPLTQRRSYLELFLSSNLRGLGVISGIGKRNSDDQNRFRQDLIIAYNASNPDPGWEDTLWCPVLSKWMSASAMAASHIFSYEHGQQTMSAIFGTTEHPELFHPRNGILIHGHIEAKFESGLFAIVPDLPDDPTVEAILWWQEVEPRILSRVIPELEVMLRLAFKERYQGSRSWEGYSGDPLE